MKLALLLLASLGLASGLQAQSTTNPDNTSAQAAAALNATSTAAAPSPSVTESIEPPSLIPPNILPAPGSLPAVPNAPELQQLTTLFKQSSLGKVGDEHRLHLQMAELEVQIRNDQDLHDLRAAADRAPTDLIRRHRLRAYYERYYGKLRALAATPELKSYLTAQEASHELALLQPRVRHETDEAEVAALVAKAGGAATTAAAPTPVQARASAAQRP